MVPLAELWLPILLAAVAVFVVSSVIHMGLKYHNSDYGRLTNEDEVGAALRKGNPPPGQYVFPWCHDPKEMRGDTVRQRFEQGPCGVLWLRPSGMPRMGPLLLHWFVFSLVVSLFAAYVGGHTVARSAAFLPVLRVTGTVAFLGYAGGKWSDTIWKGKPLSCTIKDVVDGLVYGLATGAVFGWLWP